MTKGLLFFVCGLQQTRVLPLPSRMYMHIFICIHIYAYVLVYTYYTIIYYYITIHNGTTELGSKSCFLQGWSLEIGNSFLWRVSISRFVLPDGKMEPHRKFGRHMISVNIWDFLYFWQFSQPYASKSSH